MLSPVNMFLLGIVDAKPVNPYEIVSRFEYNRFKAILGIADSTIYGCIRAMHKKGYMEYSLEQNSNLPAKKIYSITDRGREELIASVKESLSNSVTDSQSFFVGMLLMHYFSKEEVLGFLKHRRNLLEPQLKDRETEFLYVKEIHDQVPCIPNVSTSMLCYLQTKSEMDTLSATIDMLEQTEHWPQNTFDLDPIYRGHFGNWVESRK